MDYELGKKLDTIEEKLDLLLVKAYPEIQKPKPQ